MRMNGHRFRHNPYSKVEMSGIEPAIRNSDHSAKDKIVDLNVLSWNKCKEETVKLLITAQFNGNVC